MSAPDVVWVVVREDGEVIEVREDRRMAEKLARDLTNSRANLPKHEYTAVRYVRAET